MAGGLSETTRAVLLAGAVGLVVLLTAWMIGPSLFAGADEVERVVTATVTERASCTDPKAAEQVAFTDAGKKHEATLPACGHDKGEKIEVALPNDAGAGPLTVRAAETDAGHSRTRSSIGLLLIALSCVGGGFYAFLFSRTRTRTGQRTDAGGAS